MVDNVNKVELFGETLMDLTGDTITPQDVLNGVTFHDASGQQREGTFDSSKLVSAGGVQEFTNAEKQRARSNIGAGTYSKPANGIPKSDLNSDVQSSLEKADNSTSFGTCTTAEATAAKVVTLASYALTLSGIVSVKFTNAVPASATMNINGKGAKPIFYRGAAIKAGIISAGSTATFIYDGTNYNLISVDDTAIPFTSSDVADANANAWTSVAALASGETHKTFREKVSQMFKNVRYLYKLLGTTDISALSTGGTITQALMNAMANQAPAWNASTTYAVGTFVVYKGNLWLCKTQNTNTIPTEGTYWTNVTLGAQIASLNSNLSDKISYTCGTAIPNGHVVDFNTVTDIGTYYYGGYPSNFTNKPYGFTNVTMNRPGEYRIDNIEIGITDNWGKYYIQKLHFTPYDTVDISVDYHRTYIKNGYDVTFSPWNVHTIASTDFFDAEDIIQNLDSCRFCYHDKCINGFCNILLKQVYTEVIKIGTIKQQYRPAMAIIIYAPCANAAHDLRSGRIRIETNGEINFVPKENDIRWVAFSFDYVI